MSVSRLSLFGALALSFAATAALAHDYSAGDIAIGHPWARATPPAAGTAAGYLSLENAGDTADRLVSVSSPAAARVEVHEMSMANGVMQMRPVDGGLEIPPGGTVALEPGGYHLMFMDIAEPFVEGTRVPVTLTFEGAGSVEVELQVDALGATPAGGGHDGHGAH